MLCGLGDLGDRLNPRRTRADHGNPFAFETDGVLGPEAGVISLALEIGDAGNARIGRRREGADRHHEEAGGVPAAVLQGDRPGAGRIVENGRGDPRRELEVPAQVELVGDVIEVLLCLRLRARSARSSATRPAAPARRSSRRTSFRNRSGRRGSGSSTRSRRPPSRASNTRTRMPSSRSRCSWYMPEMPAPMTITSKSKSVAGRSSALDASAVAVMP